MNDPICRFLRPRDAGVVPAGLRTIVSGCMLMAKCPFSVIPRRPQARRQTLHIHGPAGWSPRSEREASLGLAWVRNGRPPGRYGDV